MTLDLDIPWRPRLATVIARRKHRAGLLALQDHRCWWHGGILAEHETNLSRRPTIEHLQPKALGGTGSAANLVIACAHCNSRRGIDTGWLPHPLLAPTPRYWLWATGASAADVVRLMKMWRRDRLGHDQGERT